MGSDPEAGLRAGPPVSRFGRVRKALCKPGLFLAGGRGSRRKGRDSAGASITVWGCDGGSLTRAKPTRSASLAPGMPASERGTPPVKVQAPGGSLVWLRGPLPPPPPPPAKGGVLQQQQRPSGRSSSTQHAPADVCSGVIWQLPRPDQPRRLCAGKHAVPHVPAPSRHRLLC